MSAWERTFAQTGDFAALIAATDYLNRRGFSVGPLERGNPIAVMHGPHLISKWSGLSPEDLDVIHGRIDSHDFRKGPVTVSLRPDVPGEVFEAMLRKPPAEVPVE